MLTEKTDNGKNILLVSARSMTRHGAQTSILNIVRVSPPRYCFTWYCPGTEEKTFADEVRQEGVAAVTGGLYLFHFARYCVLPDGQELHVPDRDVFWPLMRGAEAFGAISDSYDTNGGIRQNEFERDLASLKIA